MIRALIMVLASVLPWITWAATNEPLIVVPKAIYGLGDDRVEVAQSDALHQAVARSVAGIFERNTLSINPANNEWVLPSTPLLKDKGWCESERFSGQPAAAVCSGFLMAPDRLVTSAHCAKADDSDPYLKGLSCADIAVVFDYTFEHPNLSERKGNVLDGQQLYYCDEVVGRFIDPSGADWSVVQLDRPVTGREPLSAFSGGTLKGSAMLSVIGHPLGLPSKVATGASVLDQSNTSYIVTDLDTFAGNSGSPVLVRDEKTNNLQVFGILSRGHDDSVLASAGNGDVCEVSRFCEQFGCEGEHVTRITEIPPQLFESNVRFDSTEPALRF